MDQIILFALLGLGTGALIAGIGLGDRAHLPRLGRHQPGHRRHLDGGGLSLLHAQHGRLLRHRAGRLAGGHRRPDHDPRAAASPASTACSARCATLRRWRSSSRRWASCSPRRPRSSSSTARRAATRPACCRRTSSRWRAPRIPADRFWLTGIVIVIAALLWALYKYTRFGLATRAASESEANALLAGLSPNRLALMNTVLATLVAGFVGILASSLAQLDSTTLTLQVVPALGAVLLRALHVVRDHVRRGPGDRRRCSRSSTTSRRRAGSRPTRARRCRA